MKTEAKDYLPHGKIIRYYENGNNQLEGDAREGKQHGHQTALYKNGQKKGEGKYLDFPWFCRHLIG